MTKLMKTIWAKGREKKKNFEKNPKKQISHEIEPMWRRRWNRKNPEKLTKKILAKAQNLCQEEPKEAGGGSRSITYKPKWRRWSRRSKQETRDKSSWKPISRNGAKNAKLSSGRQHSSSQSRSSYRTAHNERGSGIEVGEIERNLHPGVSSAHNENITALVIRAALVLGRMHDSSLEVAGARDDGTYGLRILSGSNDQPTRAEFRQHSSSAAAALQYSVVVFAVRGGDLPVACSSVEGSRNHFLVEAEVEIKARRVLVQVLYELLPVWVGWEILRKRQMR